MPWAAAASSAIGAVGSIAAASMNKPSSSSGTSTAKPFQPQADALTGLYPQAQSVMDARNSAGNYTGATYSPINGIQTNAANRAAQFANDQGSYLANHTAMTADGLQGAAGNYVGNAQGFAAGHAANQDPSLTGVLSGYATGSTPINGVNAGLSGALNTAAMSGAGAIHNFNSGLSHVSAAATSDPTARLANSAQTYANSGYAHQLMDTTNADIRNTLGMTNAASNVNESNSGNLNSSRAGNVEALNNKNAAMLTGQSDAAIGNNAFNSGLSTAAQQNTSGLNTATSANLGGLSANNAIAQQTAGLQQNSGQFGATTAINAANSGLAANQSAQQLNAATNLAGNAQLGNATSIGMTGALDANQLAAQNLSTGSSAGGVLQGDQNAQLADQYAQWQRQYGANANSQDAMNAYAKIATAGWNGANSNVTSGMQTPASNMAASGLGGALAAGGLYNNYQNGTGMFGNNGGLPNQQQMGIYSGQANQNVLNGAAGL